MVSTPNFDDKFNRKSKLQTNKLRCTPRWLSLVLVGILVSLAILGLQSAFDVNASRTTFLHHHHTDFGQLFGRGTESTKRYQDRIASGIRTDSVDRETSQGNAASQADSTSLGEFENLKALLASGGFTLDPIHMHNATSGIALSIYPNCGRVFHSIDEVTPTEIYRFLIEHESIWANDPKVHIGGWYNRKTAFRPDGNNKVYLDLIVVVATEQDSIELGRQYGQMAAYNLATGETIAIMTEAEQSKWETENHDRTAKNRDW